VILLLMNIGDEVFFSTNNTRLFIEDV
jgi:hypothetical protein